MSPIWASGVKSKRQFCDVIIATTGSGSVSVKIPPHTGPATLMFDLHNRFTVVAGVVDPGQAFVNTRRWRRSCGRTDK